MAARPGKRAQVRVSGGAVAFAGEAFTTVTANTVFQITNAAKNVWDRTAAIVVKKDAVIQSAALYKLNRLSGTITFLADIGGGHVITADGSYLPMANAIEGKSFTWEVTRTNIDVSAFQAVWRTRIESLKDGKCSIGQWKTVDETMSAYILAGLPVVLEFDSDTSLAGYDIRMWGLPTKDSVNAVLTNAVEQMIDFEAVEDLDRNIVG